MNSAPAGKKGQSVRSESGENSRLSGKNKNHINYETMQIRKTDKKKKKTNTRQEDTESDE